jgi:DNA-binding LacI/PurR family transcriptional regulator
MKDVAELAGVSVQTVSAVINGKPGITDKTSDRIRVAIKQLGYRPSHSARSLRSGQTRTIALFVSDVSVSVLGRMATAAENYAYEANYNLVLYNTHDDAEREMAYINTVAQRSVDGVLFLASKEPTKGREILDRVGIPSVTIDRIPEGYSGPSVMLDNMKAGRLAAEHLLSLGHTRLAHIAASLELRLSHERQHGFVEAIKETLQGADVHIEAATNWGCRSGYEAMQRLLGRSPQPTAVFAATDLTAIGAMSAVRDAGLRVPDDISVMGLDNIEAGAYYNPTLTTIRQFLAELASVGVQMLLDILSQKEPSQSERVLDPTLIIRQSTAPPPSD